MFAFSVIVYKIIKKINGLETEMKINLKQAVEYIAAGSTPLEAFQDIERERCMLTLEEESNAKILLKEKLVNGKLEARGVKGAIEILDVPGEDNYLKVYLDDQYYVKTYYNDCYTEDPADSYLKDVLPQKLTLLKKAPDKKTASDEEIEEFLKFSKEETAPIKEKLLPDDAKNYQYDWTRSIVAQNLNFYGIVNGEAISLTTEGYAYVEINFEELQKAINLSESDFEKKKREESIIMMARTIEGKGKSLNKAANEIQEKLGKNHAEKGYSIQTITRIIEKLKKDDGSPLFSKNLELGRTPQKSKNTSENFVKKTTYK